MHRRVYVGIVHGLALLAAGVGIAQEARELPVADLEDDGNPFIAPLDRWGDWIRGGEGWRLHRQLADDAPQGEFSVRTWAVPKDPASTKGWLFTGLRVEGHEWAGLREIRFFVKAEREGESELRFHYTDSPWSGKDYVAAHSFPLSTEWTDVRIRFADMTHYPDKPGMGDPARTKAISWVIAGEPNALWLDHVRVVIPEKQYLKVQADRLRRRYAIARRDLVILAAAGDVVVDVPLDDSALEGALAAGNDEAIAAASELVKGILLTRDRLLIRNGLLRRIGHYGSKAAVLPVPRGRGEPSFYSYFGGARERAVLSRLDRADLSVLYRRVSDWWKRWSKMGVLARHVDSLRPRIEGDRWLRPNDRPMVPFAPHSMYTMFTEESNGWRPPIEDDYRRLCEWGFNGTRLEIKYHLLEPTPGTFDPDYLAMVHQVLDWCDIYGLYAFIDLHWPYPDWFYEGPEGYRNPHREEQNPYQNPEPLVETFRRLARELRGHPNIFAWEIPTNEPAISSIEIWPKPNEKATIEDIPYLMHDWNQWLKTRYGSREALDRTWRATEHYRDDNGLSPDESWDRDSVLPPGAKGVPKAYCRRVYDYMEWAVGYHTALCGRIAEVIRAEIPDAVMQQQVMAGGPRWEREALPIDFTGWSQHHADGVQVGTHYGVGHRCSYTSSLGMPSANSEEQATGRQGIYARHRARNQGACPFVLFPVKHGFCDWDFELRDSAAWMMAVADFWDSAWRERVAPVLVIVNTRAASVGGIPDGAAVTTILEHMDVDYDTAFSAYVADHPDLLRRYGAVTLTAGYGDLRCLQAVTDSGLPALVTGALGPDTRARFGAGDLADQCIGAGVLLRERPLPWGRSGTPSAIDLTGMWRFRIDPEDKGRAADWARSDHDDADWALQAVPAYWENEGVLHKGNAYDGVAWYRRHIAVPALWRGRDIILEIAAIDDLDETFVNGVRVGETGEDTPRYWEAPRVYTVPSEALRFGEDNVLAVRVTDLRGNGGIWRAPVRLLLREGHRASFAAAYGAFTVGEQLALHVDAQHPRVLPEHLADGTEVLASFADGAVLLARQKSVLWWLGFDETMPQDETAERLLASFLASAAVPCVYPPTEESRLLQKHYYPSAVTVYSTSREPVTATLDTDQCLMDMEGRPVTQTFTGKGASRVPVPVPWASNASFFRKLPLRVVPDGEPVTMTCLSQRPTSAWDGGKLSSLPWTAITAEFSGGASRLVPVAGRRFDAITIGDVQHLRGDAEPFPVPAGRQTVTVRMEVRPEDLRR